MKSIIALVLSVILCILTMNVFAGEDYYFARDDEELYGTWINLYYGTNPPQKLVYNPNGTGWSATNANSVLYPKVPTGEIATISSINSEVQFCQKKYAA